MNEMLLKVRTAIEVAWINQDDGPPAMFEIMARAAVEAMREPTEAMKRVPVELFPVRDMEWTSANRVPIWQAMIDEALK